MLQRIWTISNLLSFSRVVLLAPLAYFLYADIPNSRVWAACVIVVAASTDFLDGYLARRLHQVTDFGKILDPLADKIDAGVSALLLVAVGALPVWYVVVVVVRDVLILMGGIYIKTKKNIITQSNWPGKITMCSIALVILLAVLGMPALEGFLKVMIWLSVLMMVVSMVVYVQRLFVGSPSADKE